MKDAVTDEIETTIEMSEEYQSILPLAGKYANAPFMKELPRFLEKYDQEINELNKE